MKQLLSAAGRAFLRAFSAALLTLAPGILAAPDLESARLVGVSALIGAIAAGIRALQAYVPQLSFSRYIGPSAGRYVDSFTQAFLGALVVALPPLLTYPDVSDWKAIEASLVVAVIGAATRAVQALGTMGESITKASSQDAVGLLDPKNP